MRAGFLVLTGVAIWCAALQVASAHFFSRNLESPNMSAQIARNVVQTGEYSVPAWTVLRGPAAIGDSAPLRAYQLPGEPLYLAAGFRSLPANALRYLHVPVTTLLVTAIAAVGLLIGGIRLGALTGLLVSLDPFVLFHGPVWDDTFLSAALVWTVFALMLALLHVRRAGLSGPPIAIAICAAIAAVTRLQAQLVLAVVAIAAIAVPALRPLRRTGWAVLAALVCALTIWGARNDAALGRFFVGSSHDGVTLFRANYSTARPSILATGTAEWFDAKEFAPQYAAVASLTELDADRYYRRAAISYIWSHPIDSAETAALKLVASLTGFDFGRPAASSRNTAFAGLNLILLVVAAFAAWRHRGKPLQAPAGTFFMWAAIATTAVTLLLLAIGPVGLRYRIDLAGFTYLALSSLVVRRGSRTPSTS